MSNSIHCVSSVEALGAALEDAENDVQSAKYRADERELGYAESRVLRLKHHIADLDPNGYGRGLANKG